MKLDAAGLAIALSLATAAQCASPGGQGIISNPDDGTRSGSQTSNGNAPLFPFLTKLRDGVVELFFGKHPTKNEGTPIATIESLRTRYANEIVLRFNVTTTDEETALADATSRLFLDVWAFTDDYVDIRLHADEVSPLLGLLPKSLQSSHSTLISDVATALYESLPRNSPPESPESENMFLGLSTPPTPGDNLFFNDYQPLPVIVRWLRLLEAMFPSYVKYISIGQSYEGRDIPALKVGAPDTSGPTRPRKTLVVSGGLHAREWISTTTVNYVAWSFITSFGKEPMITKFLDHFDVVFIPVMNPDGVEYSWQVDRLWRKSRQQTSFRFCKGLDLDHAFGFGWGNSHVQTDPCSESYGGEQPFQAVEATELANWARNQTMHNVEFVGLVDLHSYSQQVLFPYSYSCAVDPPNLENLQELAAGIAKAIRLSNGEAYTVTSACEGAVAAGEASRNPAWSKMESGGGSAIDWFYHEMSAHFSYQIKLRDTGSYGFLLPREQIVPTGEEIFDALKYVGDYLLGNNGIERLAAAKAGKDAEPEPADEEAQLASQELKRRRLRR
ncbi:putative metallocarboxypeptidase ecm14 [Lecanicillium sp. MT-2017a]|nr:putative metallocarboxypeptidase ecm14 [Lecanicillium sp. MT-2017a]